MTSTLDRPLPRPGSRGPGHTAAHSAGRSGPWLSRALRSRGFRLPPDWPFVALVAGFPVWWALGVGSFAIMIFAVPMAVQLHRIRPLRVPRGFALWLCFLLAVVVSGLMLGSTAPDTLPHSAGSQLIAYTLRLLGYVAAAVLLLYVGNMREHGLTEKRIMFSLATLFVVTVTLGLAALVAPSFQFTSLFEALLPGSLRHNGYVHILVHPGLAQNQDVIGHSAPRPKAPYEYTNGWGNAVGLLVVYFVVWIGRSRLRRFWGLVVLGVAAVPVVFSLNRGLWIGLAIAILLLAVQLAVSGRLAAVIGLGAVALTLGVVFVASPLETVVQERLANPHSNDIRSSLGQAAIKGAVESPIVGWGTTRQVRGSHQSIAIGASADCANCGNADIGSTGQFWLTLFAQGILGVTLYLSFFLASLWFYRGDRKPSGVAARMTILMSMWFMFVYTGEGWPLAIQMIGVGLLWRHKEESAA